ncbi:hypothetical protein BD408DRAFT_410356 [Parasitella parasitica]|nr:hypothetical protein BD408DRAFT_410356 [Parasitella parasitica]
MIEDLPEYIIKERKGQDGETMYYVKWIGCDHEGNTWEGEEKMLLEWPTAVYKYKANLQFNNSDRTKPKLSSEKEVFKYTRSVYDWETAVDSIEYVEKSKIPGLLVYINWKNGYKSVHHSTEVYSKCPQKMIEYYEKHFKFAKIYEY